MACSPEQLASNRRNAALSCGPKTESGKSRSKRNALKHGLTGEGIVVPDEDQGAIQDRFEAFEADLKPKDAVGQYLVNRMALMSVRMDRSARHESAEITNAMLGAKDAEAEARLQELRKLVALIDTDPAEAVRQLRLTPQGFDWQIQAWRTLQANLASRRWEIHQGKRAEQLLGREPDYFSRNRFIVLTHGSVGTFALLGSDDWPDLAPDDRRQAARAELAVMIATEIDQLEKERDGIDHESFARRAATAPARALFDTSKEAILARKYEAAAEREFHRAMTRVEQLNARQTADGPADEVDANDSSETKSDELGSFFPATSIEQQAPPQGAITGATPPVSLVERPRKALSRRSNPSPKVESC
jgi:hypothetical protein